jgi:hypothetical protein
MRKPPRWFNIAFGIIISPLVFLGYSAFKKRFPSTEYALGTCFLVGVIIWLPFLFIKMEKDAVPSKSSDIVGYAIILLVIVAVGGIAYSVLK